MRTLTVRTSLRTELVDVTRQVAKGVEEAGVARGVCVVTVPHTTAGVTLNENADPSVRSDIEAVLDRLVPWEGHYAHSEGNSAAHVKASLVGHSVTLPVEGGRLVLGTWQGVFLCEFDGPRQRTLRVQVLPEV
jgi:secondary thiamine-phosphate synthase enzyme